MAQPTALPTPEQPEAPNQRSQRSRKPLGIIGWITIIGIAIGALVYLLVDGERRQYFAEVGQFSFDHSSEWMHMTEIGIVIVPIVSYFFYWIFHHPDEPVAPRTLMAEFWEDSHLKILSLFGLVVIFHFFLHAPYTVYKAKAEQLESTNNLLISRIEALKTESASNQLYLAVCLEHLSITTNDNWGDWAQLGERLFFYDEYPNAVKAFDICFAQERSAKTNIEEVQEYPLYCYCELKSGKISFATFRKNLDAFTNVVFQSKIRNNANDPYNMLIPVSNSLSRIGLFSSQITNRVEFDYVETIATAMRSLTNNMGARTTH